MKASWLVGIFLTISFAIGSTSFAFSANYTFKLVVDRTVPQKIYVGVEQAFSDYYYLKALALDNQPKPLLFMKEVVLDDECNVNSLEDLLEDWTRVTPGDISSVGGYVYETYNELDNNEETKWKRMKYPSFTQTPEDAAFKVCLLALDKTLDIKQSTTRELILTNPSKCYYEIDIPAYNPADNNHDDVCEWTSTDSSSGCDDLGFSLDENVRDDNSELPSKIPNVVAAKFFADLDNVDDTDQDVYFTINNKDCYYEECEIAKLHRKHTGGDAGAWTNVVHFDEPREINSGLASVYDDHSDHLDGVKFRFYLLNISENIECGKRVTKYIKGDCWICWTGQCCYHHPQDGVIWGVKAIDGDNDYIYADKEHAYEG